jgi:hypothetical protein
MIFNYMSEMMHDGCYHYPLVVNVLIILIECEKFHALEDTVGANNLCNMTTAPFRVKELPV